MKWAFMLLAYFSGVLVIDIITSHWEQYANVRVFNTPVDPLLWFTMGLFVSTLIFIPWKEIFK